MTMLPGHVYVSPSGGVTIGGQAAIAEYDEGGVGETTALPGHVYVSPSGGVTIGSRIAFSPYNPSHIGIAPIYRNEVDSNAEIMKQTGGLWEKLGKISASMLTFFPGATYFSTARLLPSTLVIPDIKPKNPPPSKTGGTGVVNPPPDAKSPPMPDPDEPKWDPNDPFAWWKTLLGIKPPRDGYSWNDPDAPPDAPPPPPPDPDADDDSFWNAFKTSRGPVGEIIDNFGNKETGIDWLPIALIGGSVILLILIIK